MPETVPGRVPRGALFLCTVLAGASPGLAVAGDALALEGTYTREHPVLPADPYSGVARQVLDTLELSAGDGDGLVFAFTRQHAGGRTCTLSGVAAWKSGWFEFRAPRDSGAEARRECVLRIVYTPLDVTLRDVGRGCGPAYCDGGIHMDGVRFRRGAHPPHGSR